jgi:hypothetical protein
MRLDIIRGLSRTLFALFRWGVPILAAAAFMRAFKVRLTGNFSPGIRVISKCSMGLIGCPDIYQRHLTYLHITYLVSYIVLLHSHCKICA